MVHTPPSKTIEHPICIEKYVNFTQLLKTKTTGKLASCLGVFPTPYNINNTEFLFSITTTSGSFLYVKVHLNLALGAGLTILNWVSFYFNVLCKAYNTTAVVHK